MHKIYLTSFVRHLKSEVKKDFFEKYQQMHSYTPKGSDVVVQSIRVIARISRPIRSLDAALFGTEWRPAEAKRDVYFGSRGFLNTPVLSRSDLKSDPIMGPAVIEEADSSTVIQPGCEAKIGKNDVIVVDLNAER